MANRRDDVSAMAWTARLGLIGALLVGADALGAAKPLTDPKPEANARQFKHRGFTVDISGLADDPRKADLTKALAAQIDAVAKVGLKPDVIAFFQSLDLKVEPHLRGFLGTYKDGVINLAPWQLDTHDPTLLHEFLHALHAKRLPQGYDNAEIVAFFKDAAGNPRYEGTNASYFLTNNREFFAVTATVYLSGSLPYNRPYSRNAVKAAQPAYYGYLEKLFGAR